jgi:hypothetical protein
MEKNDQREFPLETPPRAADPYAVGARPRSFCPPLTLRDAASRSPQASTGENRQGAFAVAPQFGSWFVFYFLLFLLNWGLFAMP